MGFELLLLIFMLSSASFSSDSYLDATRIDYRRPTLTTQLELIGCFTTGNCKQDDKIRIYPMPCEGSAGSDCTGCYRMQGGAPIRIGDLNSFGTCSGVGEANEQKLRVFVGYERSCPVGTPIGASCSDGQLLLSCNVSSEGDAGASQLSYNQDCFAGRPYVRRAQAGTTVATALPSYIPMGAPICDVGTGGVYPSCLPCSDTSYKSTTGDGSCIECASPLIANALSPTYSTAGTSKSSVNDCKVVDFTCMSGFVKNSLSQSCDAPVDPELLSRVASPTPDPTPSPSPSPRPTGDCGGARVNLNLLYVSPTQMLSGVDQKKGYIGFSAGWDKTLFMPDDYFMMTLDKLVGGSRIYVAGYAGEISTSSFRFMWTMYGLVAGDYVASIWPTRFGVACPKSSEIFMTVPIAPVPSPSPSPLPMPGFCNIWGALTLNGLLIESCANGCIPNAGYMTKKSVSCLNAAGAYPNPPQITTCGSVTLSPGSDCGVNAPPGCIGCVPYYYNY